MAPSATNPAKPVAAYTDWAELDIGPASETLRAAGWEVRAVGSTDPDAIVSAAADATVLCLGYARLDAALLSRLPDLRLVATLSAGFDMVDVDAATARGVWVATLPDVATEEVAVHAYAMALALVRRLGELDRDVRSGSWELTGRPPGLPQQLTLGLLGMGRIGRLVAELGRGVFREVAACDPHVPDTAWPAGVQRAGGLDALLGRADVLSLHLPAAPGAPPVLGADQFARMPTGAYVVNVSRGGLLDSTALAAALDTGRLAGAAVDVLDREPPPPDHPLSHHPRVLVTPHVAYMSDRTLAAYPAGQAENVLTWQRTGRPRSPVVEVA